MDARDISEQIAAAGAIITLPDLPLVRRLVGEMRWDGDNRMLWFAAFGDTLNDAQAIEFEEIAVQPVGVCFMERGELPPCSRPSRNRR